MVSTFRRCLEGLIVALAVFALPVMAAAAPITFFGEDAGLGEGTALASNPNASAAQAAFLSSLINPGVETFETLSGGAPLAINFANGVTATLNGDGAVTVLPEGVTNGFGRYGVTRDGGDERYWDAGSSFTIDFDTPVSAFGFFGIDIGDFNGQVTATTAGGLAQVFNIPNSTGTLGGGVLFWGVIDPTNSFTSVTFGNTAVGVDVFAFDNFTVGTPEQVQLDPVPEPATLLLLGSGLAGAALRRRAKKRQ